MTHRGIRIRKVQRTLASLDNSVTTAAGESESASTGASDSPAGEGDDPSSRSAQATSSKLCVRLQVQPPSVGLQLEGYLDRLLVKMAASAGATAGDITVAVVDDGQMSKLHQQFLGLDTTTDVLTFDLRPDGQGSIEADIVICIDEARRQAEKLGHDVRNELLLYALHGVLHLLGYDDHDSADAQRMHEKEDQLLEEAGVGRIYRPGGIGPGKGTDPLRGRERTKGVET